MKRVLFGLVALVAVIAVAAGAFIVFFPKDLVVTELKKQTLAATGRTLALGDTSMTFWPALGLSAQDVVLSNPAGYEGAPFLKAQRVVFAVSVAPLLGGDIQIKRLVLESPELSLLAPKDKPPNWTFPAEPAAPGQAPAKLKSLSLEETRIRNGRVVFRGADGVPVEVSAINAALSLPSLDAPATLAGDAVYRKEKVLLDLRVTKPRALAEQGETPITLKIDSAPIKASVDGAFNTATGALAGAVDTSGTSVRRLIAWLAAPLPAGGGFGPFAVKSTFAVTGPTVSFSKGVYRLDSIAARGDIAFRTSPQGRLSATGALTMPLLDVNPYLPATPTANADTAATPAAGVNTAAAWDTKPLDLAGLRAADADLSLSVGDLRFQKMQFTNGQVRFRLNGGVADATLSRIALYGGAGTGRLVLDASRPTARLRTELDVTGVEALPLLTAAIGFDKIEGKGTLKAALSGEGRSQADIMRTLSGSTSFSFNDGAWRGVNLAQVARTVQSALAGGTVGAAAKTDFAEFAADFAVAGGVANTENLRLLNPFVRLDGKGAIDIGGQGLDMHLSPRAVRAIEGQGGDLAAKGIGVPFRVSGAWSAPKFRPDLEGLAQSQISRALGGRSVGEALGGLIGGRKKDGEPAANPLERLLPKR